MESRIAGESSADVAVRLAIMEVFLTTCHASLYDVAELLNRDVDEVAATFDRLAVGRAIVLVPGTRDILMAAPFSGVPTDFIVRVGQRRYFANCIWDALGVPAMLLGAGRTGDAEIETRCADCDALLRLTVRSGRVSADPAEPVAHFAVPASRWWEDIAFT